MYSLKPVIKRNFFDSEVHSRLISYLDDWVPLMPVGNDKDQKGGSDYFGRRYIHNDTFISAIHDQLADYASTLFGTRVKPSYSFLSMYDKGGNCPLHVDRPQCRYTIDYLIRQEQSGPWPIAIGPEMNDLERIDALNAELALPEERQKIIESTDWTVCNLAPNDAVCYSGTHSWHYRPEPSKGTADLIFFHFVPRSFQGSLA